MQEQEQNRMYYLGGDISKGYCDFVLLDQMQRIVEKNFQVDDTPEGHKILSEKVKEFLKKEPQVTIHIGFESTGGYENNWVNLFLNLSRDYNGENVKVARLNSYGVNHHHKAGLKRNSTDKISAKDIAEYLITHADRVHYNNEDAYAEGRSLYRYIEMLTKQRTQLINLLEKQVYKGATSLIPYWQEEIPRWLLSVLTKWPTDESLARANVREVDAIAYVSKDRALELIKNARLSVASSTSLTTIQTIKSLAEEIIRKGELIEQLKKQLYTLFESPDIEILKSIPCVQDYTAYGLYLEIGNVERFASHKNLCSHFGIHPVYKQSGDGSMGYHLSKQGRKRPRRLLYLVAMNIVQRDQNMSKLYDSLLKSGRKRKDALCIIMHKLARIIYALLKKKTKYQADLNIVGNVEQANIETGKDSVKRGEIRRFHDNDELAPISRRQLKKRQKQNPGGAKMEIIKRVL